MQRIPQAFWIPIWISLLLGIATGRVAGADGSPTASGPAQRVPWTSSRIVGSPEPPLPYTTEPYLPGLAMPNTVFVTAEPGTRKDRKSVV